MGGRNYLYTSNMAYFSFHIKIFFLFFGGGVGEIIRVYEINFEIREMERGHA